MKANEIQVKKPSEQNEYYFKEGCYILELLNDESDAECSIARARVLAGKQTRWHKLLDTSERYVILEGKAEVHVGELKETVSKGNVIVIPSGEQQRIVNKGEKDLVFLAICTPRFKATNYVDLDAHLE